MALSNSQLVLNAHRATLRALLMLLEQTKNAPNWGSANKIHLTLN
jgi:bisphosphoglycerate-dependent phosphoglycerate mutase